MAWRIGSLESIPRLHKHLQIRVRATLDSRIGSLESIPGLLERLQIRAQATLASGIGSLESIPRLHNLKNEDKDDIFWIETNIFIPQLGRRITNLFVTKLSKERKQTKYLFLNYRRNEDEAKYLLLNYRRNKDEAKY